MRKDNTVVIFILLAITIIAAGLFAGLVLTPSPYDKFMDICTGGDDAHFVNCQIRWNTSLRYN